MIQLDQCKFYKKTDEFLVLIAKVFKRLHSLCTTRRPICTIYLATYERALLLFNTTPMTKSNNRLAAILLPSCCHLAAILLPSCCHLAAFLLRSCVNCTEAPSNLLCGRKQKEKIPKNKKKYLPIMLLLPLPPPPLPCCCCTSPRAATAAEVALPPSCHHCYQAGCRCPCRRAADKLPPPPLLPRFPLHCYHRCCCLAAATAAKLPPPPPLHCRCAATAANVALPPPPPPCCRQAATAAAFNFVSSVVVIAVIAAVATAAFS